LLVIVLWPVQAACDWQIERCIFEQRSRSKQALLEGETVEERFERGTSLPPRPDAIDVASAGKIATPADIGQNISGGIVHHQDRAIFDLSRSDRQEMTL